MSLELTKRAEAQIRARSYFGQFEQRLSVYGAFKAFLDNATGLLPKDSIEGIKNQSNGRSVYFPVLTKASLAVITARACTIAGVEPSSVKPQITRITRGFEIKVYPKVGDNNGISTVDQLAQGWVNGLRSVLGNLDTYSAAQLESNKSTVLAAVGLTGLNVVANAYQLDPAQREKLYLYIGSIMAKNDLDAGVINNIATTESMELMAEYETRGANNDQNLQRVLAGDITGGSGYRHYRSNRITNGAGVAETHYLVPAGGIGVFMWNDSDAINKRKGPNDTTMYTEEDSIMGIRWDVAEAPVCDDLTATYGEGFERTVGTKYQIAADFGFMQAYSSDGSKANIKLEVLSGV